MKALLTLLALAFAGCSSRGHRSDSPWTVSPQGYRVQFIDQGTVSTGKAALSQIYEWHAQAVERDAKAVALKHGKPVVEIMALAQGKAWDLVDNCVFFAYGNENLPATGQYIPQSNTIRTCLYVWKDGTKAQIPQDAPPWTIRQDPNGTDHWRWGVLESGRWFPTIAHEMGHVIKGPAFEH